jgi:hypothetical protein
MGGHRRDRGLENLLDLNGQVFVVDLLGRFVARFSVNRIPATPNKPHGIDYSLTLLGPDGRRIIGYDNAHPIQATKGPSGRSTTSQDHRHRYDRVRPYKFVDAGTLMEDFWKDVRKILEERRSPE